LRIDPQLAPAHANLGLLQAAEGQFNESMGHYRLALRIDPDFAKAHSYLGVAVVAKGRRDEAEHDYPKGVKGLEQFRDLALREARDYYFQVEKLDPDGLWPETR
jgi:Flp pilus assembly protein TadD